MSGVLGKNPVLAVAKRMLQKLPPAPVADLAIDPAYWSMTDALEALRSRRRDSVLARRVEAFRLQRSVPEPPSNPSLILMRALFSPDLELARFVSLLRDTGLSPFCLELSRDRFASFNPDKYCRAKMVFRWGNHQRSLRIIDFGRYDGRPFDRILTRTGMPLHTFHRRLIEAVHPTLIPEIRDASDWILGKGNEPLHYLPLLSLAIRDGILVENFRTADPEESRLARERLLPSVSAAQAEFGVAPLLVRLYPMEEENQSACWHYPGTLYPTARTLLSTALPG